MIAANSRIVGKVTRAKPASKLHHNGELRVVFEKVSTPEGIAQAVQGNLSGVSVDRAANVKMDEEGGTRVTDNKSRYLLTGLSLMIAASAAHGGDRDAPGGSSGVNPGAGAAAGAVGFKLVGAVVSVAGRSRVFSSGMGPRRRCIRIFFPAAETSSSPRIPPLKSPSATVTPPTKTSQRGRAEARTFPNFNWFCSRTSCPDESSRTPRVTIPGKRGMVRPERFELPTFWFVAKRSIQLS